MRLFLVCKSLLHTKAERERQDEKVHHITLSIAAILFEL